MSETVELVITRTFNAPRELVFEMFTHSEHLKHWWGPTGWTLEVIQLDARPGGCFHFRMRADENVMWSKFIYREISTPEKLVYVSSFCDEEGNITRAPFIQTLPLEILNTFTFEEQNGNTMLTLRTMPLSATEEELETFKSMHDGMQQGFGATFDQLEQYMAAKE
ncbi:SRPBCC domain-containing protein [Paenibacillus sp. P96]|uniref:SRPBCC domain-containing protein n=1 Tax=Paenibacillus zeirhizosphaerae TaxID=2987519 RepID=A0ABT9FR81_9BACL|nr:SRPBCC domain-containing protein [Paenibacillus sp. P96]MDP4097179.1 SRPBCC domain-containing protein [Paenibacillus sp. P96]